MFVLAATASFFRRVAHGAVVGEVLQHALLDPCHGLARAAVGQIGVCRRIGLPMSLFSVTRSLNTFSPTFDVPCSLPVNRRRPGPRAGARVEDAGHQRQEARVGARLEDDRVAARLERARLLALQRLVGRDLGELRASIRLMSLTPVMPAQPEPLPSACGRSG